jgi:hypothetical protein
MNSTPEQQWSALSALYEEADALPAHALAGWLARLEGARHPLLPQLKRMLEARQHMATDDFLGTLPKLSTVDARPAAGWAAGSRVGPYRLVRPLGEGGMAQVWLAERDDGAFKRQVAVKLPYPWPGRESFALRFDRERDILASLRHPNIAGLFDAGITKEGQAWLALEYVEGEPISTFCDRQRLGLRERVTLFRQVLLAAQHAHANLVIHRDLKPANILVTPRGDVRLLDFGIAKLLEAEGDATPETELTRQAGRSLTPRYASPEQLTGQPLTIACDVYSLGVVFYELLCGEQPYELKLDSPAQLEHAIMEVEPRAPSRRALGEAAARARGTSVKALRRGLAPELDAIALRCLAKQPAARYSSVDAVLADVDRWLGGEAVLARAPGAWYRFGKFAARHRLGVGLGVAAVLSLAAVAAVAVVMSIQAREESARAVAARDFMLNLFKRADQEKSRGADITARELLEGGRRDLLSRLEGQPRLQAELLQGIGTIQMGMGEYVNADSTFADAARIYAQLGMPRETTLARVAHADNALRAGDPKRALSLLRLAKDVPHRPKADAEVNARLGEVEGWIANIQGRADQARALFTESRREATKAFGPYHAKTMEALRGLIFAERQLRNFDGALVLQGDLEAAAAKTTNLDPKELAALDGSRADLLYAAGRYAEDLSHVIASQPRCAKSLGPNEEGCRRLVLNKMQAMLRLGMTQRAQEERPLVESMAEDRASPTLQAEALFLLFRLESLLGVSTRQRALFDRVQAFGESGSEIPVNSTLKVRALLALAESRLLQGDPEGARQWVMRASAQQGQSGVGATAVVLGAVAESLTGVAFLQSAQPDKGLESLRPAQAALSEVLGPQHPLTQLFSLNVALALDAVGKTEDALALVVAAEPILRESLGTQAPTFLRVQRLKTRLQSGVPNGDHASTARTRGYSGTEPKKTSAIDFFS